jgi:hypothetical protein
MLLGRFEFILTIFVLGYHPDADGMSQDQYCLTTAKAPPTAKHIDFTSV